jgi:hypothetical protein
MTWSVTSGLRHEESYKKLAGQLDALPFEDVIKIISTIEDGKYRVLPWLKRVSSNLSIISPYNLCRCSRTETLILPQYKQVNDILLVNLPYIQSLTINAENGLDQRGDVFMHLNYLEELQIISDDYEHPDLLLNSQSVIRLAGLKLLHVYNNELVDDDFKHMINLEVLVIESRNPALTPALINLLPKLQLFVFNKVIYRYVKNTGNARNSQILKRLSANQKLKVYMINQ